MHKIHKTIKFVVVLIIFAGFNSVSSASCCQRIACNEKACILGNILQLLVKYLERDDHREVHAAHACRTINIPDSSNRNSPMCNNTDALQVLKQLCAAQDGGDCDQNGVACSHAHGKHVNSLSVDCDCDGVVLAQLDACHSCTTIDQDRNNDGVNHNTSDVILQSIPSQQNVKENV